MEQQGVDQRPGFVARRRMHHHPLGLVDDGDIPIFIDNIQRDILRLCLQLPGFLGEKGDHAAFPGLFLGPGRASVYQNLAVFYAVLKKRAGMLGEHLG